MKQAAAVILAAGASRRLGAPKQLVTLAGERLLERAVRIAREAHCSPLIVVLGAEAQRIEAGCELDSVQIVNCSDWQEGIAASIRAGIEALTTPVEAAVVMTCDQPAVTAEHLRRLVERCESDPIASSYAGRTGVPACFRASHFPSLLQLRGDAGARGVLDADSAVELPGGEMDIDTADALQRARTIYGA